MAGNFYQVSPYVTNLSLGASVDTDAFFVGSFDHIAIQKVVTGASSLNGTLQLQKSVDGTSWDNQGTAITVTADVVNITQINDVSYGYIRYVWTRTAGTGTLNIKIGTINHAH